MQAVKLCAKFRLGGLLHLDGPSDEATDILFKLMVGEYITHEDDLSTLYVPPFLRYSYCPEVPVLFEGSIMKNLLLGAHNSIHGIVPTAREAWKVARMCGLDSQFLDAPESFNVGKGGRNLPLAERQIVSLARCILSDPCVLLLQKPFALLPDETAVQVQAMLLNFVELGGLFAMLSGEKRPHGQGCSNYLTGNGTRTVIFTGSPIRDVAGFIARPVSLTCEWCEWNAMTDDFEAALMSDPTEMEAFLGSQPPKSPAAVQEGDSVMSRARSFLGEAALRFSPGAHASPSFSHRGGSRLYLPRHLAEEFGNPSRGPTGTPEREL